MCPRLLPTVWEQGDWLPLSPHSSAGHLPQDELDAQVKVPVDGAGADDGGRGGWEEGTDQPMGDPTSQCCWGEALRGRLGGVWGLPPLWDSGPIHTSIERNGASWGQTPPRWGSCHSGHGPLVTGSGRAAGPRTQRCNSELGEVHVGTIRKEPRGP